MMVEITEEMLEDLRDFTKKLRAKYESITSCLESVDSQMTEFYVLVEDFDYILNRQIPEESNQD